MRASDLMFGDWVNYLGKPTRINGAVDFTRAKDFEPIPLTAEILEKNGFRKGSYIGGYYYPLFTFRVIPTTRDMDSYFDKVEMIEDVVFYHCRYVHELQHALRLCGLNELADNLII